MKSFKYLLLVSFLVISSASFANGEPIDRLEKHEVKSMSEDQMAERMLVLEERVTEIEAMDLSELSKTDRKDTKKELKYIQREMHALGSGGIYLSTGALLVIIILILIL